MATNIPPHNLNEIINGCLALIENPKSTIDNLLEIISGPDFPTGGIIDGKIIREFQPIPLEVGLESDISFTKGCYTGQELIARMDAREALARTLVTISSDSLLDVGNHKIVGGGKLVVFDSVADSVQYTSLGLIHPDFAESGNEFNLDEINCTVVAKW